MLARVKAWDASGLYIFAPDSNLEAASVRHRIACVQRDIQKREFKLVGVRADWRKLLRTLMAWLRGEPRVCSMVPIPNEADEEARRAHREREELTGERRSIVNKIDGILATLGVKGFRALRRDRRDQLTSLHQPDGEPVPQMARARIERLLDRLELVLKLIDEVEATRDAVFA